MVSNKNKIYLSIIYVIALLYSVFFTPNRLATNYHYQYNCVPFRKIVIFIMYQKSSSLHTFFMFGAEIFGNIALFLPMYFALVYLCKYKFALGQALLMAALFSFIIESVQYACNAGIGDVDDIILNTLGAFLGSVIYTKNVALQKQ